jgi:hypothetical protein
MEYGNWIRVGIVAIILLLGMNGVVLIQIRDELEKLRQDVKQKD